MLPNDDRNFGIDKALLILSLLQEDQWNSPLKLL